MIKFKARKLVRQGGSKTVALPAAWLNGFPVPVESVEIVQGIDNSLVLRPVFEKSKN